MQLHHGVYKGNQATGGYKKNFMLNSAVHEIFPAHKC